MTRVSTPIIIDIFYLMSGILDSTPKTNKSLLIQHAPSKQVTFPKKLVRKSTLHESS